jgi:hypothetical protein
MLRQRSLRGTPLRTVGELLVRPSSRVPSEYADPLPIPAKVRLESACQGCPNSQSSPRSEGGIGGKCHALLAVHLRDFRDTGGAVGLTPGIRAPAYVTLYRLPPTSPRWAEISCSPSRANHALLWKGAVFLSNPKGQGCVAAKTRAISSEWKSKGKRKNSPARSYSGEPSPLSRRLSPSHHGLCLPMVRSLQSVPAERYNA